MMDTRKIKSETTKKSIARQIRDQLEQMKDKEFILQVPLTVPDRSEVKSHERKMQS